MVNWLPYLWMILWGCLAAGQASVQEPAATGNRGSDPSASSESGVASGSKEPSAIELVTGADASALPSAGGPIIKVTPGPGGAGMPGGLPAKSRTFWEEVITNPIWLMLAMLLAVYLGVVLPSQRSNRAQQKQLAEQLAGLKKNDRVVTTFGVHGVVVSSQPDAGTVTLRIDENTNAKMTVSREAIRVVKKD